MNVLSEQAKALFLEATEGHAPEDWPAFLDRACADDSKLRAGVERLLRARAELGSFHENARPLLGATIDVAVSERPGSSIGPYKLLQQLGEGGMGTVFMAEQTEPVKRKVALKVIKAGMDSRQVIARFEAERQALAMMDHVNIARVFDGGATENGRPYFVMELVHGVPITKYCDDNHLTPRQRLELFVPVCQAIQHAHQKGIIHRDIKPSNVLIALYDDKPVVKVIDFGVAKATGGALTEHTIDTGFGGVVGTPQYMSPEQASGQGHWADRRTDIYSFGVMLFKLLTDELPFRGSIQRQIQQRLTDDAPDPRSLNRFIPRDLATIVLKCLERDPNKRYLTAAALADELRRFLRGEPIKARPISRVARMARWAKRKPAAATAIALATLLAIGGPLVTWSIEQQRQTLAANLIERNNIIARNAVEAKRDGATITRLQGELDLWEGRANPWKFWPPEPTSHPRKIVLNKFFADQYPTLSASLNSNKYNSHELAAGNLGLALMAEKLKKSEVAEQHLLAAKELLETLSADEPANESYQLALAQCLAKLAQVYGDKRRDEAAELLAEATTIYKQLATSQQREPDYKVDWLATELFSGTLAGFEAAKEHLQQATEIEKLLPQVWPTDPLAVYNFAAYLTEEAPVLGASPK